MSKKAATTDTTETVVQVTTTKKKVETKYNPAMYLQKVKQPEYVGILLKSKYPMEFKTISEWNSICNEIKAKQISN